MRGDGHRWLELLKDNLAIASSLRQHTYSEFIRTTTMQLAFEAIVMRVGDLSKRLIASDPDTFSGECWLRASRARDFTAHHYHRVDLAVLYETVAKSFTELEVELIKLGL